MAVCLDRWLPVFLAGCGLLATPPSPSAQQAVNVLAKFDAAKMPLVTSQPHQQTTKGYIYFDFLVSSVLKVIYPSVHRVLALRGGNI
jgi:hypothetical protein